MKILLCGCMMCVCVCVKNWKMLAKTQTCKSQIDIFFASIISHLTLAAKYEKMGYLRIYIDIYYIYSRTNSAKTIYLRLLNVERIQIFKFSIWLYTWDHYYRLWFALFWMFHISSVLLKELLNLNYDYIHQFIIFFHFIILFYFITD